MTMTVNLEECDRDWLARVRPFRGRLPVWGQRVFAYRNLAEACWSLRAVDGPEKGRVTGRADSVALYGCTFVVSERGRQRVLREQQKNVHAGILGTIVASNDWDVDRCDWRDDHAFTDTWITYNPYKAGAFMAGGVPVASAMDVHFGGDGRVRAGGSQFSTVK